MNLQDKINQLENTVKELEGSYRTKLEYAIERLRSIKSMKSFSKEESLSNSLKECLLLKNRVLEDKGNSSTILKQQSIALLSSIENQTDCSYNRTVLESLKHALSEFLGQLPKEGYDGSHGGKFLESPLRLCSIPGESYQEEPTTDKRQVHNVSKGV